MAKGKKFPLWLHPTGQWTKKIRGKNWYFGTDPDAALKEYVRVKDDLEAGRSPRARPEDATTVAELCNQFLTNRRQRVDSGELSIRTWSDYHRVCDAVVAQFGRDRSVIDLRPDDFAALRAALAERMGVIALHAEITRVRTLFKFGFEFGLIDVPVRYGSTFDRPHKKYLRLEKARRGVRMIAPGDAWKLLDEAEPQLRAMILLGLNGGLGASDCSGLTRTHIDYRPGWIDYPRPKTGIARRIPLWPETTEALAEVRTMRPYPRDDADVDRVFVTRYGRPWVRFDARDGRRSVHDAISDAFARICERLEVKTVGRFNVLRHSFRTIADETRDRPAIDLVMGHGDHSMAAAYREVVGEDRLQAVTDHVRAWLLSGRTTG